MNALQSRSTRRSMVLVAVLALLPGLATTGVRAQAPVIPDLDVTGRIAGFLCWGSSTIRMAII